MKTVLITGSSRGIGKATTEKFLSEGWKVLGASTSSAGSIRHKLYSHFQLDLRNTELIRSCADAISRQHTGIDVLICCAGVSYEPDEDENKMDISVLRKILEVNLVGTIDFIERMLPVMKPSGHIAAISSMMSSLVAFDNGTCPAYRISKTALNMYVKTLADRLKTITVSAFDPGWVRTDMGGKDAPRLPEEPAAELYDLVTVPRPSGNFWYGGKVRSW